MERLHYDSVSEQVYDSENDALEPYRFGFSIIVRYSRAGSLFDVGAGRGEAAHLATTLGFNASGIEPSQKSCEYALNRFKLTIENGFLEKHWAETDGKHQVITLFHVLEHVKAPRQLLRILRKKLADDGVIYIEVPNGNALLLRFADALLALVGRPWTTRLSPLHPPFHNVAYSQKTLRFLLESEGFVITECDTYSPRSRCRQTISNKHKFVFYVRNIISSVLTIFPDREVVYVVAKRHTYYKCPVGLIE
jgi:2-polyprenyl-3-methyl-5-hydroxy-6-metoxy-1,4-benzoquinol methylase